VASDEVIMHLTKQVKRLCDLLEEVLQRLGDDGSRPSA